MEVHHHSHHGKKKWTEYLWEFLMLFLAVFCGFLAEYQLEHKIEKDRGKQYLLSFYEDLKADTATLNHVIRQFSRTEIPSSVCRSCFALYTDHLPGVDSCLSELFDKAYGFTDLLTEDRTLQQLKNAGGLRLLPAIDADSILGYDRLIRNYQRWETTGMQECQYRIRAQINILSSYHYLISGGKKEKGPVLFRDDPEKINLFFVTLQEYAITHHNMQKFQEEIREKAISLLNYFKTKYHF